MKEVSEFLHVRHRSAVLRGVLYRPQTARRYCGYWAGQLAYCSTKASPTLACQSHVFASVSSPDVGQRQ